MADSQGYYSLLQYAERPDRAEFVNIGLLLITNDRKHIRIRMSKSARRVERVFKVRLDSSFGELKKSMERRIKHEFSGGRGSAIEDVERFISLRADKVRLSPLRSVLAVDPDQVLQQLFSDLVGEEPKQERGPQVRSKLRKAFENRGVVEMLDNPEPIDLPQGIRIEAPYGYQNCSYNLINPVSLRSKSEAVKNAGEYALEGLWLYEFTKNKSPKRLVVVGDLDEQPSEFVSSIKDAMEKNDVRFYILDQIDPLIEDIKRNARQI